MGYASRGEEVSLFNEGVRGNELNCRERKEDSQTQMYLYSVRMGNKIDPEQYMALLSKNEESCRQGNFHQRERVIIWRTRLALPKIPAPKQTTKMPPARLRIIDGIIR